MKNIQPHLRIKNGDIAPIILLPGDPGRIKRIVKYWEKSYQVANNREFLTFTGTYKGIPVSCTSTGIGSPSAAIAVEELAKTGAKIFIRVGTCGALMNEIQPGHLIIPIKALCLEGTTREYFNQPLEAKADTDVIRVLKKSAQNLGVRYFSGVNRTHDAFYEPIEHFINLKNTREYKNGNLISSEMECSAIFTVARLRGLKSGAVLAVNTSESLEKMVTDTNSVYQLNTTVEVERGIEDAIKVALMSVVKLNSKL